MQLCRLITQRMPIPPSAWKMTNAMESWSWNGCDGNAAKVEVYTRADHVKLYINGKCVGTKKPKNDCKVFFDTTYQNGEIKAVAYDANDNIIAERTLTTAGKRNNPQAETRAYSWQMQTPIFAT